MRITKRIKSRRQKPTNNSKPFVSLTFFTVSPVQFELGCAYGTVLHVYFFAWGRFFPTTSFANGNSYPDMKASHKRLNPPTTYCIHSRYRITVDIGKLLAIRYSIYKIQIKYLYTFIFSRNSYFKVRIYTSYTLILRLFLLVLFNLHLGHIYLACLQI